MTYPRDRDPVERDVYTNPEGTTRVDETHYADGSVNRRVEQERLSDLSVRDNDNAARGLLIGILLTSLLGLAVLGWYLLNRQQQPIQQPSQTIIVPNQSPNPTATTQPNINITVPNSSPAPQPPPQVNTNVTVPAPSVSAPNPTATVNPPANSSSRTNSGNPTVAPVPGSGVGSSSPESTSGSEKGNSAPDATGTTSGGTTGTP